MYEKIHANSTPQETREYVLENVFWVPVRNCSSGPSSGFVSELCSETLDSSEASSSDNFASTESADNQRAYAPFE
jgi:hypothetical protein